VRRRTEQPGLGQTSIKHASGRSVEPAGLGVTEQAVATLRRSVNRENHLRRDSTLRSSVHKKSIEENGRRGVVNIVHVAMLKEMSKQAIRSCSLAFDDR
jgi:hypothetical protein